MITCSNCGGQNRDGARFCTRCGRAMSAGVSPALSPGDVLQNRYVIVKKIGQGGMGAVYQATDKRIAGKSWAIKEILANLLNDPTERQSAIAAFQREAQLLATLHHTNLPKVADSFDQNGKYYLVMDFVDGQTLEQAINATPGFLPEATVINWIDQVCDVLTYLHSQNPPIIFRDLKPANIMVTPQGQIKLIDFGIVRFFKAGKRQDTQAYGTMGYAAPEQLGTGQTDARSDIYSLGVTLHNLLTKYNPAQTPFALPSARSINAQVTQQTENVIVRATKQNPGERFQTAREMKQALRPAQARQNATLPASPLAATSQMPQDVMSMWRSGKAKWVILSRHASKPKGVAFSPDGKRLAVVTHEGIAVWDVKSRKRTHLMGEFAGYDTVRFPTETTVVAVYASVFQAIELGASDDYKDIGGITDVPPKMCCSSDGAIHSSIEDRDTGFIRLCDNAGKVLTHFQHLGGVIDVDISPDGKLVASTGNDGTLRLWEPDV